MIIRILIALCFSTIFAQTTTLTVGDIANNISCSLFNLTGTLIIGGAYLTGIVIFISAVFKFKQYKDNSTQIPIGTAFALFGMSVVLIFLPGLYSMSGQTLFGSDAETYGYTGSDIFYFGGSGSCGSSSTNSM